MLRRGFSSIVCYLDDFLVAGETFEQCISAYNALIGLLRELGFMIAWNKVCDPCQKLTFLGISIDTRRGTLSLEHAKVQELQGHIRSVQGKHRVTKRQLESIAGRLAWASNVIPWGSTHLRHMYNLIAMLKHPPHKCRTAEFQEDLCWWQRWLSLGNNTHFWWDTRPVITAVTDASSRGGGAFCLSDWVFSDWEADLPNVAPHHINVKELASVYLAARRWATCWKNHRIIIYTDNTVTESIVNKGSSSSQMLQYLLKELCYLALKYNFTIVAKHIAGKDNKIADCISRLHEKNAFQKLMCLLDTHFNEKGLHAPYYNLHNHMSYRSLSSLSPQLQSR